MKVRDSAKNIAIEKGLEHAAHKTGGNYLKLKASAGSRVVKAQRPVQPLAPASYRLEADFSKDRHRPKKVPTSHSCFWMVASPSPASLPPPGGQHGQAAPRQDPRPQVLALGLQLISSSSSFPSPSPPPSSSSLHSTAAHGAAFLVT